MLAGRPIRADTLMRNLMMASRPSKLRRGTVVIVNVYLGVLQLLSFLPSYT